MKVKELIYLLSKYDPEMMVITFGDHPKKPEIEQLEIVIDKWNTVYIITGMPLYDAGLEELSKQKAIYIK